MQLNNSATALAVTDTPISDYFDRETRQRIIETRQRYPKLPGGAPDCRTDLEFLRQCEYYISKQIGVNKTQAIKGFLIFLNKDCGFPPPIGYVKQKTDISDHTKNTSMHRVRRLAMGQSDTTDYTQYYHRKYQARLAGRLPADYVIASMPEYLEMRKSKKHVVQQKIDKVSDKFVDYCKQRGIKLMTEDMQYIAGELKERSSEERKRILKQYVEIWRAKLDAQNLKQPEQKLGRRKPGEEPSQIQGRRAANTYLRETANAKRKD